MKKRSILAIRIEALGKVAAERREQLAASTFKLEIVFEQMANAAASGYRVVKISPPQPIELAHTSAGLELAAQLKEAGVDFEWVSRSPTDVNTGERFSELVVRW